MGRAIWPTLDTATIDSPRPITSSGARKHRPSALRDQLLGKLQVASRVEAALLAYKAGLASGEGGSTED
jgi:hypothetical protein